MRGPGPNVRRRSEKVQPSNEAVAGTTSLPAPVGGWNTVSALAAMPPLDAVEMVNLWPTVATVELRKGSAEHATGLGSQVQTLMPYSGGALKSLWAATASGIYNVTAAGAVGAPGTTCTNGVFSWANFSNSGGNYLVAVNGVDNLRLFNGTTWQTITGASVPAITGLNTNLLSAVAVFKRRLWFARKDSLDVYYLPAEAIAGALVVLPLGGYFSKGGSILSIATWTIDGGNGPDDYIVFLSNKGEMAVFQGLDPASSTDFSLIGSFFVGEPVGPRCLEKFGGDLIYYTQAGLTPLSKILLSTTLGRVEAVSQKTQKAFADAAKLYGFSAGWQVLNYAEENMLLVNIPASSGYQKQYVMNTLTRAWTQFQAWNANCFAVYNGQLYYGGNGEVARAWVGTADKGVAITGYAQQAYNTFGRQGNKHIQLTRLNVATSSQINVQLRYLADFAQPQAYSQVTVGTGATSVWDSAAWDSSNWAGDLTQLQTLWLDVPNKPAYFSSLLLRVQSSVATFTWTSTDFVLKAGGIL
jgi:hypothetical protein